MASIRTAGLTKNLGDLRAVNEIDLDLPEGGVAGLVGPNGAHDLHRGRDRCHAGWRAVLAAP